jgi:hypothetical protein
LRLDGIIIARIVTQRRLRAAPSCPELRKRSLPCQRPLPALGGRENSPYGAAPEVHSGQHPASALGRGTWDMNGQRRRGHTHAHSQSPASTYARSLAHSHIRAHSLTLSLTLIRAHTCPRTRTRTRTCICTCTRPTLLARPLLRTIGRPLPVPTIPRPRHRRCIRHSRRTPPSSTHLAMGLGMAAQWPLPSPSRGSRAPFHSKR